MELSPTLMVRGAKVWLSCPVAKVSPPFLHNKHVGRVCAIEVGINNAAVAAVVVHTGMVIARKFLTCGRYNAQRDHLNTAISKKQRQTSRKDTSSRIGRGF